MPTINSELKIERPIPRKVRLWVSNCKSLLLSAKSLDVVSSSVAARKVNFYKIEATCADEFDFFVTVRKLRDDFPVVYCHG
jgi:hypothetical protein